MEKQNATRQDKIKMLVCTDGSEHSYKAAREAARIAAAFSEAEVMVLHVCDNVHITAAPITGFYSTGVINQTQEQLEKAGKNILEKTARCFEEKNIKVHKELKTGHTFSVISEIASDGDFDLVVVGSRGLSGVKKLILGSVSHAVVQELDANVLVVK